MAAISRDELKTIIRFGIHIARIDGDFAAFEKRVLRRFADTMGLTQPDRDELLKGEASLATGLKSLHSADAKNLLIKTLCAIAHSDGTANKEELEFIEKVISKFSDSVFVYPREEWGQYEDEVVKILQANK
jgi:tellurite resistance protein